MKALAIACSFGFLWFPRDCLATHFRFASSDRARVVFPLLLSGPNVLQLLFTFGRSCIHRFALNAPFAIRELTQSRRKS